MPVVISKYYERYINLPLSLVYPPANQDNASMGEPILFQWIEKLKEIVESECNKVIVEKVENKDSNQNHINKQCFFNVIHGTTIHDRKSIFQGHVCSIQNHKQVKEVLEFLLQNKKIAQATHNILAYRINIADGSLDQGFDDDGEAHAGGRLLNLLQIINVTGVVIIVSRWYGGIHLGPVRFRHINNAARQVLEQADFLPK